MVNKIFKKLHLTEIETWRIFVAVTVPVLFKYFFSNSSFFGNCSLDPYNYLALFHNYTDRTYFEGAYKLARLPWILLGYLSFSILAPGVAHTILNLFLNLSILLSFYLTVKLLFNRNIAFIGTIALGFSAWINDLNATGGSLYHNLCAVNFYAWGYYFASKAAIRPEKYFLRLFLAGIFFACAVHSMILILCFTPLIVAQFFFLNRINKHSLFRSLLSFIAGGVFITLLLMIVHFFARGEFIFFKNLVNILFNFATNPSLEAAWWKPWDSLWFLDIIYWVLPVSLVIASIFALFDFKYWKNYKSEKSLNVLLAIFQLIFIILVYITLQNMRHHVLSVPYMAFPIIIPTFLALSALIYYSSSLDFLDDKIWPIITLPLIFILSILLGGNQVLDSIISLVSLHSTLTLFILYSVFLFLLLFIKVKNYTILTVFILLISFLNVSNMHLIGIKYGDYRQRSRMESRNVLVWEAQKFISNLDRYSKIAVWYDMKEGSSALSVDPTLAYSILNTWLGNGSVFDNFHVKYDELLAISDLSAKSVNDVYDQDCTIVLVATENERVNNMQEEMEKRFKKENVDLVLTADVPFQKDDLYCRMKVLKVFKKPIVYEKLEDFNLDSIFALNNGQINKSPGSFSVFTPKNAWNYAAQLKLDISKYELERPLIVRVTAEITKGRKAGFSILNTNLQDFTARSSLKKKEGKKTIDLVIKDPKKVDSLIMQNWDKANSAEIRIYNICLLTTKIE